MQDFLLILPSVPVLQSDTTSQVENVEIGYQKGAKKYM